MPRVEIPGVGTLGTIFNLTIGEILKCDIFERSNCHASLAALPSLITLTRPRAGGWPRLHSLPLTEMQLRLTPASGRRSFNLAGLDPKEHLGLAVI